MARDTNCFAATAPTLPPAKRGLLVLGLVLGSGVALAQPANDMFTNAMLISGLSGTVSGTTQGATKEPGEPNHYTTGGHSVWFSWTAPINGTVTFDTAGSFFDTLLAAYTGTNVTALTPLASDDDSGLGLTSLISFPAYAGTNYMIAVDGYFGASGLYTLNWYYGGAPTNCVVPPSGTGEFQFSACDYWVREDAPGFAKISVITGGGHGVPITVDYATADGTAVAGTDYIAKTGRLTFNPGETVQSFTVQVLDNSLAHTNKTVLLRLSNPGGGTLGPISNAVLTIVDDETLPYQSTAGQVQFTASTYDVTDLEYSLSNPDNFRCLTYALITVTRVNGGTGRILVDYYTTNAPAPPPSTNQPGPLDFRPAVPGWDYLPVSGTLVFDDFQASTNFTVRVFPSALGGNAVVQLVLHNPRAAPEENPSLIQPTLGLGSTADLRIINVSTYPRFAFERLHYRVDEYNNRRITGAVRLPGGGSDDGQTWVDIRMHSGVYWWPLEAGSDYATPGQDYVVEDIRLVFGSRDIRREFTITINPDTLVEFNEDIQVMLWRSNNRPIHPYAQQANFTILYDDEPPGMLDREWNPDFVPYTPDRDWNRAPGANNQVFGLAVQPDNKTLLVGDFTAVNTVPRNRVARLNPDGSLDTAFMAPPNTGADGFVSRVLVQPDGRVIIVGGFSSFNGTLRNGLARLNADGSLDTTFHPGTGANGPVWAVALQPDGKIIIGGEFTTINEVPRPHLARLNSDGSLDFTFDPRGGADRAVWALALVVSPGGSDSGVYLGGDFTSYAGQYCNHVCRINPDGSLDPTFNPGTGTDGPIYALAVQNDGRLLLGGAFSSIDNKGRNNIARLNADGTLDTSFDPGTGPNDAVYAIALRPDGRPYLGGIFTSYNGTRRVGLAMLRLDGTLDTRFLDTAYNQFAGLCNPFSFQPRNQISAIALQPDGHLMIGGSFTNVGGNQALYLNESANDWPVWTRDSRRPRFHIARLRGDWGRTGGVLNPEQGPGNIEWVNTAVTVDENQPDIQIRLQRVDGNLGTAGVTAATTNRLATAGLDYTGQALSEVFPEWAGWARSDGYNGPIWFAVPILDDFLIEGNETVDLGLGAPFGRLTLGGEYIPLGGALGRNRALLTIVDNDFHPGTFTFDALTYYTNEHSTNFVITVLRTNGTIGTVSVDVYTRNGTALAGEDYTYTSNRLMFASGVTNRSFLVPILNDTAVEFDEFFEVVMTNATGGALIPGATGLASATNNPATNTLSAFCFIIDNDYISGRLNFAVTNFLTDEGAGYAEVTVTRSGGNVGPISATVVATNGTALHGQDFLATNVALSWVHGDVTPRTVLVPILDDALVEGPETIRLWLTNESAAGALGNRSRAIITLADDDAYGALSFSQPVYAGDENGTNVILTVVRQGGVAGAVSVQYTTADGSALAGWDYVATSGVLNFAPGQTSTNFSVHLIDNPTQDGDRALNVVLLNPGGGAALGTISNALLNIVDDESSAIPAGSVDTTFLTGTGPDKPVYSLALQADGRILIGGEFDYYNQVVRESIARLHTNGLLDTTFDVGAGFNDQLRAMALDADGKLVVGGFFTTVNGVNRAHIARLWPDGTLDEYFNPGAGADNPVFALAIQPDGRIVVGGAFTTFNGVTRPNLVRLNTNGTLHAAFNVGTGPNGVVYALALQADGKILIGGDFTAVNNVPRGRLARLHANGSLDLSFDPGLGADAPVRALAVQSDGRILVGGSFTNFNGQPQNYFLRLEPNGRLDTTFMAGQSGANDAVLAIALQADEKIIVGGTFTRFNGVTRNRINRLNPDGTTDPSINFGEGANGFVAALLVQPDRKIVAGGGFSSFDGQPRRNLVRLHGGSLRGAGQIEFSTPFFTVVEDQPVATLNAVRRGGTFGAVEAQFQIYDGTATGGLDFVSTNGTLTFPQGEVLQTISVPILDDALVEDPETAYTALFNPSGGAQIGVVPVSTLTIVSDDCVVSFDNAVFNVAENSASGTAVITVSRTGSTNGAVSVQYAVTTDIGALRPAAAGDDFIAQAGTLNFAPGQTNRTLLVTILDDALPEGTETVRLLLTNAAPANRASVGLGQATLYIMDNEFSAGELSFSSPEYTVSETGVEALITVTRRNGSSGLVSVNYATADGTATRDVDYRPVRGTLAFADGETNKTFAVPVLDDPLTEPDETVLLALSNPGGGALLGAQANAVLRILDDESAPSQVRFVVTNLGVNETEPVAVVAVARADNLTAPVSVDYASADGTATAGLDYLAVAGRLDFGPGETLKTFEVPILGDELGEEVETVALRLLNPQGNVVINTPVATLYITNNLLAGGVDGTFNGRWGADGPVYAAVFDANEKLYVAGDFQYLHGLNISRVGRLTTNGTVDIGFLPGSGPNGPVYALGRSTNGLVLGGAFTNVNGLPRGRVARLRYDGSVDLRFDSAAGADDDVLALVVQRDDRVVIGGRFRRVDGQPFNRVARLHGDGVVDANFAVGSGADGTVRALALTDYGTQGSSIIVGGDFRRFDGRPRAHVARLNADGSLDAGFNAGLGPDGPVWAVAVQGDGRVLIAGDFETVDGVPRNRLARLHSDGTVDLSFDPGLGADRLVRAVDVQADGKVVVAGDFVTFDGNLLNRLVRLNTNGTVDATFDPGAGANGRIYALAVGSSGQPNPRSRAGALSLGSRGAEAESGGRGVKIVGGQAANIADYPYQVALVQRPFNTNNIFNAQFCGGSIVNDRWVLTAAHCVDGMAPGALAVAVGVTDLTAPGVGRFFDVDRIVVHPNWDPATSRHDVALLHLTTAVNFNAGYVADPVRLVSPGDAAGGVTDPGRLSTITGWGNTSGTGGAAYPNVLQVATVPITDVSQYPAGQITADMLLAGYPQGGVDTCQGDSGGPLVVTNSGGQILQAGITSWGNGCALPGYPGVYSRVSYLYDWIVSQITEVPPGPVASTSDKIAVGGEFTRFDGKLRNRLAVLDNSGRNAGGFDPATVPNRAVFALGVYSNAALPALAGKVVVAGDFTDVVGVSGQNRLARLHADGSLDTNFSVGLGPDGAVRALALQTDGRVVIGGGFTNVNGVARAYLARLNTDGSVDGGFNAGVGINGPVSALALEPNGKLVIGGRFTSVYGVARNGLARLNANGTIDTTFDPGLGVNGSVNAILRLNDGSYYVGGEFSTYNGVARGGVARVSGNGTLDGGFDPGSGCNGPVFALGLGRNGGLLIGGHFTRYNGATVGRLVRVMATGALDGSFSAGLGADDFVSGIGVQADGKLMVVGSYIVFNGQRRHRLARLNEDGSFDATINFGTGADNTVHSLALQNWDGKILIGGAFTSVNGEPRVGVARLIGGTNEGGGVFQFSAPAYAVAENGTNVEVTVRRVGGTSGAAQVRLTTEDGTGLAGRDYTRVDHVLDFAEAETVQTVAVGIVDNGLVDGDRTFGVRLSGPIGAGLGAPSVASVRVQDDDGVVEFTQSQYFTTEGSLVARVQVVRTGGTVGRVTVDFATGTNGTATAGVDYEPVAGTLVFNPGVRVQAFDVAVTDDPEIELPESVPLVLSNVTGSAVLGRSNAVLEIVDNDFGPGAISWETNVYVAPESGGAIRLGLVRTNGYAGNVTVGWFTLNGSALSPWDYVGGGGTLTFAEGETNKTLSIRINDETTVEGDEVFYVVLTNATGGAVISGEPVATVRIEDDDFGVGSLDRFFDPGLGANGLVRSVAVDSQGRVIVGGAFTQFNGTNRLFVARLGPGGGLDADFPAAYYQYVTNTVVVTNGPTVTTNVVVTTNLASGANSFVASVAVLPDDRVVLGGGFTTVNGVNFNRVARLTTNGAPDVTFTNLPAFNGSVNVVAARTNARVVVGGSFGLPTRGITQLRANGSLDAGFNVGSGTDGSVHAARVRADGGVWVGGAFGTVDGTAMGRVALLGADGGVSPAFVVTAITNGTVYAVLEQPDGKVVVGGDFVMRGATNRVYLARLNGDGSVDGSFGIGSGPNGPVFGLGADSRGRLLLGGEFTLFDGRPRVRYARLEADGRLDEGFDPGVGADGSVLGLAVLPGDDVIIVGAFGMVSGVPRAGVARIVGSTVEVRIEGIEVSAGQTRVRVGSRPGVRYTLQASADLLTWAAVDSRVAAGPVLELVDPGAGTVAFRFYRVKVGGP